MDVPAEIMELGDKIANLKLTEAVALKEYLKEKYKLEPAAGGGGGGGVAAPVAPVAVVEAKTEFTVILEGLADPGKKISVIKVVREVTGLGLKEAKDLVDAAPKQVKAEVKKAEAEEIAKKLKDAGAEVELK